MLLMLALSEYAIEPLHSRGIIIFVNFSSYLLS